MTFVLRYGWIKLWPGNKFHFGKPIFAARQKTKRTGPENGPMRLGEVRNQWLPFF
jgi:hypothetical protein